MRVMWSEGKRPGFGAEQIFRLPTAFYFLWNLTALSLIFIIYKVEKITNEIILIKYLPE